MKHFKSVYVSLLLNKGIQITLKDEREEEVREDSYHYEGGLNPM